MFLVQQIVNGVAQGSIYALMAIGYAVVMGVVGLVTFTHGEVIMVGAFAGFYALSFLGTNIVVALLAGFSASFVLGIAVDRVCYRPFRKAPRQIPLICTIGMSIFLRSGAQVVFGTEQRLMPSIFENKFLTFGDVRITYIQILIVVVVILLSIGLHLLFSRSRLGISLRAVSMDKDAAALLGVNVNRTILIGNSIGCALGGVGGVLLGCYYNAIHPVMGGAVAMKAFTATVFGGLTSVPGAAIGGLLLGIFENLGVAIFSAGYRDIIAFVVLITMLLIKPSGLFGTKGVEV